MSQDLYIIHWIATTEDVLNDAPERVQNVRYRWKLAVEVQHL